MKNVEEFGTGYVRGRMKLGDIRKQILVPKLLRVNVIEVAHTSLFGGHLGVKKTEGRIQTNFFWPGLYDDVSCFCRLCDICQKTVPIESVPRAPLGDTPLIEQPFKRVAIDLAGPIAPASDKGHRYILTLVDYATRYPEYCLFVDMKKTKTAKNKKVLKSCFAK